MEPITVNNFHFDYITNDVNKYDRVAETTFKGFMK